MNAGELRKLLSDWPDETPVFVDGYEGGYDIVEEDRVGEADLIETPEAEGYYGRYNLLNKEKDQDKVPIRAIILYRSSW